MSDQLSERQNQVLVAIEQLRSQSGFPPSIREICSAVGLNSVSSGKYQVDQLKALGLIDQIDNISRGISLSEAGERYVQELQGVELENLIEVDAGVRIPLVGQIAAGIPITAEQNVERYFSLPRAMVGSGELFGLKVKGESMIDAAICDGDYVVVRKQSAAENGDIVAALLDDEATVKTFKRRDGQVWLIPRNSTMEPIPGDHSTIMGKVVAVFRSL